MPPLFVIAFVSVAAQPLERWPRFSFDSVALDHQRLSQFESSFQGMGGPEFLYKSRLPSIRLKAPPTRKVSKEATEFLSRTIRFFFKFYLQKLYATNLMTYQSHSANLFGDRIV
jgi:hypothetical protein